MCASDKTTPTFYKSLGKLFYDVAFADKQEREEESLILQQYVKEYWLDYDDLINVFNSDSGHLRIMVFEDVQHFEETPEAMYDAFVTYKDEQSHLFTERANNLILATARASTHISWHQQVRAFNTAQV
jgi:hypothetical protein